MHPYITTYRGIAHPWLCDRLGHLNTRHYFAALDDAMQHFFSLMGYVQEHNYGWADVQHHVEYKSEIRLGSLFHVECALVKIGNKAITYRQRIVLTDTGEIAAECEAVTVRFSLEERRSVEAPSVLHENAEAFTASEDH